MKATSWRLPTAAALLNISLAGAIFFAASGLGACGGASAIHPPPLHRGILQLKTPLVTPTPYALRATVALPTPSSFVVGETDGLLFGIAYGADGNIWVSNLLENAIDQITPAGSVTEFPIPTASSGPTEMTLGSDSNVWFSEDFANAIARITPAGAITEFPLPLDRFPPPNAANAGGDGPRGVALGPDGNIWFCHTIGNEIGVMSPSGAIVAVYPIPTTNSGDVRIALGPDGNMWFTESFASKVARINTVTGKIDEFPLPTAPSYPVGIHKGLDGNVWFTEADANQYGRITMSGAITEFVTPFPLSRPLYITSSSDGSLWFAERFAHGVARVDPFNLTVVEYTLPRPNALRTLTEGQPNTLWVTDAELVTVRELTQGLVANGSAVRLKPVKATR